MIRVFNPCIPSISGWENFQFWRRGKKKNKTDQPSSFFPICFKAIGFEKAISQTLLKSFFVFILFRNTLSWQVVLYYFANTLSWQVAVPPCTEISCALFLLLSLDEGRLYREVYSSRSGGHKEEMELSESFQGSFKTAKGAYSLKSNSTNG